MSSFDATLTPEQLEIERRRATSKRTRILVLVAAMCIGARFIIRDPKKVPPPDHMKKEIKIVPGMLDTMPASARASLDPQLVAKMILADEMAKRGEWGKSEKATEVAAYKAADAPAAADVEAEAYKEQVFAYARRKRIEAERDREKMETRDTRKSTVVQFASGGYVRAEGAAKLSQGTQIRIDNTIQASVPNRWVSIVRNDALDWEEPVPPGLVRLKPAAGITVILHKDAARRITVEKKNVDEI